MNPSQFMNQIKQQPFYPKTNQIELDIFFIFKQKMHYFVHALSCFKLHWAAPD